ncbi:MAG: patatin-like phospholipase family protein, partial [Candidatus Berkiella sp.]
MAGKYKYLALEGGGAKGYIYLGVADALDKMEILKEVEAIAGASVGAIGALLLATGWPVPKMRSLFNELKFSEMARGGWWEKFIAPLTFLRWFGLHRADRFHELFKK